MIVVRGLTVTYPDGTVALRSIDLTIGKGECALILGRSGSGKSTLGKVLSGIIPHVEKAHVHGYVRVVGLDPARTDMSILARVVAYLAQSPYEQVIFTYVRDELELVLYSRYGTEREDEIRKVAKMLRIEHILSRRTSELSGGELQKVLIASVLLAGSEVIVLDEPLAHLDPVSCRELLGVVEELKRNGRTVILIEHRFSELVDLLSRNVVDKVVLLDEGKLVEVFPARETVRKIDVLSQHGIRLPYNLATAIRLGLGVRSLDDCGPLTLALNKLDDLSCRETRHEEKTVLEIRGLYAAYRKLGTRGGYCWVLRNINLEVAEGEITCIMGPNGSGKSTLLLAILGKIPYVKGTVLINGVQPRKISRLRGRVMYIPQNPDLVLMYETVERELLARARLSSRSLLEASQKIRKIAKKLELLPVLRKNPQALSRGQRFRVAVAAALVAEPRLLLLDEPTVGQDEDSVRVLGNLLREYVRDNGAGALVVTHDVNFVIEYSDEVVLLRNGEVVSRGSYCDVFANEKLLNECGICLSAPVKILVQHCVRPSALLQSVRGRLTVSAC